MLSLVSDVANKNAVVADDDARPITNAVVVNKNAPVGNKNAVIAVIDDVPAAINYVTTPYNNLMSAVRHESAGWSVEPSNVNGIN